MEDASVEIMGRDGQLQNPGVNIWYLFKVIFLKTFSCTWTKYTLYILFKFLYEPDHCLKKNCYVELMQTKQTWTTKFSRIRLRILKSHLQCINSWLLFFITIMFFHYARCKWSKSWYHCQWDTTQPCDRDIANCKNSWESWPSKSWGDLRFLKGLKRV